MLKLSKEKQAVVLKKVTIDSSRKEKTIIFGEITDLEETMVDGSFKRHV